MTETQERSENFPCKLRNVRWRSKKRHHRDPCSLDGQNFVSVRQAYGYFASARKLEVGLLCASTEEQGVGATFDSLKLSAL